ncbi:pentapeptide repeat-containing protein [Geothrix fermentans]|uniref:pentapeptide repeat-containing protein n=1 Tax=Geothrix fermentans TaxID=44676 RepID=UPI0009FE3998
MLFEAETYTSIIDGPDLSNGHIFSSCTFENLENLTFLDATFLSCLFENCVFYWSDFMVPFLYNCKFEQCTFAGSSFRGCRLIDCSFESCTFTESGLGSPCHFEDSKWVECHLVNCKGLENNPWLPSSA